MKSGIIIGNWRVNMTLAIKSCPKCKGDLRTRSDHYGSFQSCIQCGFVRDEPFREPAEEFDRPVRLPYAGKVRRLKGAVLLMKFHTSGGHIVPTVFCPIINNGIPCRLEMTRDKYLYVPGESPYKCDNYHSVTVVDEAEWR